MSIEVNKETCIGCGSCVSLCPSHFQMGADGKSEVKSQEDAPCVKEAIDTCPVQAISIS